MSLMPCRQPAATAWDQLLPVHGRAFFAAGGFRPNVGLQGLRYRAGPGAGNYGGQGQAVVVVDRSGASTPHMGRGRGLGTTWLMGEAITLARGSKALIRNPHPPPGPSPKCCMGQGGRKCWQVCRREKGSMPPLAWPPNNTPTVT